jgi:hypothetical protein
MIIAIIFLALGIFNFRWSFSSNVLNNVICVSEAIDKTDPREVLDYRIMLFLGVSLLVIVPVSILLILTPVIIITLRKQIFNRKNLTKQGKHNKQVLKATTMLISSLYHLLSWRHHLVSFTSFPFSRVKLFMRKIPRYTRAAEELLKL